jgi:hypothetical protein
MPLSYVIDTDEKLITITGEYAAAAEWRDILSRVLHDPRREPGFGFLRDLRGASRPVDAATVVGILQVVRQFWPHLQPSRAAVLTPRDFDPAALVAHALADAERMPLQMFTSYEAAREWLREGTRPPGTAADPEALMTEQDAAHDHTPEEERRIREAALDRTIEGSFPASDPPSTDPNPDDHDAVRPVKPAGD